MDDGCQFTLLEILEGDELGFVAGSCRGCGSRSNRVGGTVGGGVGSYMVGGGLRVVVEGAAVTRSCVGMARMGL